MAAARNDSSKEIMNTRRTNPSTSVSRKNGLNGFREADKPGTTGTIPFKERESYVQCLSLFYRSVCSNVVDANEETTNYRLVER